MWNCWNCLLRDGCFHLCRWVYFPLLKHSFLWFLKFQEATCEILMFRSTLSQILSKRLKGCNLQSWALVFFPPSDWSLSHIKCLYTPTHQQPNIWFDSFPVRSMKLYLWHPYCRDIIGFIIDCVLSLQIMSREHVWLWLLSAPVTSIVILNQYINTKNSIDPWICVIDLHNISK